MTKTIPALALGQRWQRTARDGTIHYYEITFCEDPTVKGPYVYLTNEATGKQAMISQKTLITDESWQPT